MANDMVAIGGGWSVDFSAGLPAPQDGGFYVNAAELSV
jgi:hypothetical protein